MTGVLGVYFLLRFGITDAGAPPLASRSTGFGFSSREPAELLARFSYAPLMFYGYNIVSSIFSVAFSEPRAGVWAFTRDLMEGDLGSWQVVNIVSSSLVTALIGRLIWTRRRRWAAFNLEHGDRLVLVFLGVLVANAAISYPYTKDVIMSPAGVFYALAAYVATRDLLESARAGRFRFVSSAIVTACLVVLSATWCVRSIGNHYSLREQAFRNSSDWTELDSWTAGTQGHLRAPTAVALSKQLGAEVARTPVPNPYFWERAAPEVIKLFDPY